jgi:hypothetical protein
VGAPIVVSNALYDQFAPDIAWDPTEDVYLVTFVDCRNKGAAVCFPSTITNGDIYGQIVASGGKLTGINFPVATSADLKVQPAVGFSSTSDIFQVIYSDRIQRSSSSSIYGQEVSPSGTLV